MKPNKRIACLQKCKCMHNYNNINKQVVYSYVLNQANYQSIVNMKTVHKIITSIIHMCFMANDLIYVINYFIFLTV